MKALVLALPLAGCVTFHDPKISIAPYCPVPVFPVERANLSRSIMSDGVCVRVKVRETVKGKGHDTSS